MLKERGGVSRLGEGLDVARMMGGRKTSMLTLGEMKGDPNVEDTRGENSPH